MKKLTMLTLLAVAAVSLAGCSCGWPRWLCRGDNCGTCGYGEGTYSSPSLMPPSYITGPELPGPIMTVPIPGPAT